MQIRRHRRRRAHRGDWAPWRHLNGSALKNSSNLFLVSRAAAGVRGTELGEGVWRHRRGGDAAAQGRAPRQRLFRGAAGCSTYNMYGAACRAARDSRALVQIPARDAVDTTRRS